MTLQQVMALESQAMDVAAIRKEVERINLSRTLQFDALTNIDMAAIYNGYGPDSWPKEIRAAVTWIYRHWKTLALIHDVDFHFSDGTRRSYLEATARWSINYSLALSDRYPMTKPWLYPARAWAWTKLRLSLRALQLGSWPAWQEASRRRERSQEMTPPVTVLEPVQLVLPV